MFRRLIISMAARAIPAPSIRIFSLGMSLKDLRTQLPNLEEDEVASSWVGCIDYRHCTDRTKMTFSIKDDGVKAIIYNTDIYADYSFLRTRKLRFLLKEHEYDCPWEFTFDTGFGFLYRSQDGKRAAAYAYVADVFSTNYGGL